MQACLGYSLVRLVLVCDLLHILFYTVPLNVSQASYLPLISHLRALLKKAHKKSYTVSVGKLNPAKLANFAEIECFVLVACPENSVVESKVRLNSRCRAHTGSLSR